MAKGITTDPETCYTNIVADNIAHLKSLFPEAFVDGEIDFDVLRQLLGDHVLDTDENYGLTWHGKRRARQLALAPSTGTLRPSPAESVNWVQTQNLIIDGDNLEVLKLLQKSYTGKVKLIYIDPPYNTGKDFVYTDDYRDNLLNYLAITGQIDDDSRKLTSNVEASGRFHTQWLNMLYPRLVLARHLLSDDGAIFVSIDEHELPTLRLICNELFGDECFVSTLTILCNPKGRSQDKYFATNHEYVVVCSKRPLPKGFFSIDKDQDQIDAEYRHSDDRGKYRLLELRNTHREFSRHNRPNLFYPLFASADGGVHLSGGDARRRVLPIWNDGFEGCWTWDRSRARQNLEVLVAREVDHRWKVYRKSYASGSERMLKTILNDTAYYTERGQKEFNYLFETREKLFQSPKSPYLLAQLIETATAGDDLILDFFAGSGTTAHAVMIQNSRDGQNRRFILVQLPEQIDVTNKDQRSAALFCDEIGRPRLVSELLKERVRRAASQVFPAQPGDTAVSGFRVFRLDTSNIRRWDPENRDLGKALFENVDRIKDDRTSIDVLYELLLRLGIDLCASVNTHTIAGKSIQVVDSGVLVACLDAPIRSCEVEKLARGIGELRDLDGSPRQPIVVFRDSAFADDVMKANLFAMLEQLGLEDIRTL